MSTILDAPLATPGQLARSPSQADGLTADEEASLRFAGTRLVFLCGVQLNLPQSSILAAQVLLQRFYVLESFVEYPVELMVPATLSYISKLESRPFPATLLLATITTILHSPHPLPATPPAGPLPAPPPPTLLHKSELSLAKTLSFPAHPGQHLPHVLALSYLQLLDLLPNAALVSCTLAHLNDAVYSPSLLYLTHPPHHLACAAIYLAARECDAPERLPVGMEVAGGEWGWWDVFDVEREELGFVVVGMRGVGRTVAEEGIRVGREGWGWVVSLREEVGGLKLARTGAI